MVTTKSRKPITLKPGALAALKRDHESAMKRLDDAQGQLRNAHEERNRWSKQAIDLTAQLKDARARWTEDNHNLKRASGEIAFWRGVAIGIDPGRAEAAERIRQGRPPRDAGSGRIVMDQKGEDPSNGIAWRNKAF